MTVNSPGWGKEVKTCKQVKTGGEEEAAVMCNKGESARLEGKTSKTVVGAAVMFGLEIESLRKRQNVELQVATVKILTFSFGETNIRGTGRTRCIGDNARKTKVRWFKFREERLKDAGVGSAW